LSSNIIINHSLKCFNSSNKTDCQQQVSSLLPVCGYYCFNRQKLVSLAPASALVAFCFSISQLTKHGAGRRRRRKQLHNVQAKSTSF